MAISLDKMPKPLISLAKTAAVSVEKAGLGNHTARVGLALDISGSMSALYQSRKVQTLVERILALASRFDDDGNIDVFLFGLNAHQGGEVTLNNFASFTDDVLRRFPLEGGTNYSEVMRMVREHYYPGSAPAKKAGLLSGLFGKSAAPPSTGPAPTPVYLMFVTDGAASDEDRARDQIKEASRQGIFWQFMAIGDDREEFPFLDKLDTMSGRFLDNANLMLVPDPSGMSEQELFDSMLAEYPGWVRLAREKKLIV